MSNDFVCVVSMRKHSYCVALHRIVLTKSSPISLCHQPDNAKQYLFPIALSEKYLSRPGSAIHNIDSSQFPDVPSTP